MLRVLMLNYEFPPVGGGGANATQYILRQFAAREDLTVDLVTSGMGAEDETLEFAPNITVHRLGVPG